MCLNHPLLTAPKTLPSKICNGTSYLNELEKRRGEKSHILLVESCQFALKKREGTEWSRSSLCDSYDNSSFGSRLAEMRKKLLLTLTWAELASCGKQSFSI